MDEASLNRRSLLNSAWIALPLVIIMGCLTDVTNGQARMLAPMGRSSQWRYELGVPTNFEDHLVNCGGVDLEKFDVDSMCGVCGDNLTMVRGRYIRLSNHSYPNAGGGMYAKGKIRGKYNMSDEIVVKVQILASRLGYIEFHLCPNNDFTKAATSECMNDHPLLPLNGTVEGFKWIVPDKITEALGYHYIRLQLPVGLKCAQCVLRMRWRTGTNWGDEGIEGGLGLGPQEYFFACTDIQIGKGFTQEELRRMYTRAPYTTAEPWYYDFYQKKVLIQKQYKDNQTTVLYGVEATDRRGMYTRGEDQGSTRNPGRQRIVTPPPTTRQPKVVVNRGGVNRQGQAGFVTSGVASNNPDRRIPGRQRIVTPPPTTKQPRAVVNRGSVNRQGQAGSVASSVPSNNPGSSTPSGNMPIVTGKSMPSTKEMLSTMMAPMRNRPTVTAKSMTTHMGSKTTSMKIDPKNMKSEIIPTNKPGGRNSMGEESLKVQTTESPTSSDNYRSRVTTASRSQQNSGASTKIKMTYSQSPIQVGGSKSTTMPYVTDRKHGMLSATMQTYSQSNGGAAGSTATSYSTMNNRGMIQGETNRPQTTRRLSNTEKEVMRSGNDDKTKSLMVSTEAPPTYMPKHTSLITILSPKKGSTKMYTNEDKLIPAMDKGSAKGSYTEQKYPSENGRTNTMSESSGMPSESVSQTNNMYKTTGMPRESVSQINENIKSTGGDRRFESQTMSYRMTQSTEMVESGRRMRPNEQGMNGQASARSTSKMESIKVSGTTKMAGIRLETEQPPTANIPVTMNANRYRTTTTSVYTKNPNIEYISTTGVEGPRMQSFKTNVESRMTSTRSPGNVDPGMTSTRSRGNVDPGITNTRSSGNVDPGMTYTQSPGTGSPKHVFVWVTSGVGLGWFGRRVRVDKLLPPAPTKMSTVMGPLVTRPARLNVRPPLVTPSQPSQLLTSTRKQPITSSSSLTGSQVNKAKTTNVDNRGLTTAVSMPYSKDPNMEYTYGSTSKAEKTASHTYMTQEGMTYTQAPGSSVTKPVFVWVTSGSGNSYMRRRVRVDQLPPDQRPSTEKPTRAASIASSSKPSTILTSQITTLPTMSPGTTERLMTAMKSKKDSTIGASTDIGSNRVTSSVNSGKVQTGYPSPNFSGDKVTKYYPQAGTDKQKYANKTTSDKYYPIDKSLVSGGYGNATRNTTDEPGTDTTTKNEIVGEKEYTVAVQPSRRWRSTNSPESSEGTTVQGPTGSTIYDTTGYQGTGEATSSSFQGGSPEKSVDGGKQNKSVSGQYVKPTELTTAGRETSAVQLPRSFQTSHRPGVLFGGTTQLTNYTETHHKYNTNLDSDKNYTNDGYSVSINPTQTILETNAATTFPQTVSPRVPIIESDQTSPMITPGIQSSIEIITSERERSTDSTVIRSGITEIIQTNTAITDRTNRPTIQQSQENTRTSESRVTQREPKQTTPITGFTTRPNSQINGQSIDSLMTTLKGITQPTIIPTTQTTRTATRFTTQPSRQQTVKTMSVDQRTARPTRATSTMYTTPNPTTRRDTMPTTILRTTTQRATRLRTQRPATPTAGLTSRIPTNQRTEIRTTLRQTTQRMATPTRRRQTTQRLEIPTTRRPTATQRMATPTTRRQTSQRMATPTTRIQTNQRITTPTTRRQTTQRMATPTTRRQTTQRMATPTTRRQTTQRMATPITRRQTSQRMATPTARIQTNQRITTPTTRRQTTQRMATPTTRRQTTQRMATPTTRRQTTQRMATPTTRRQTTQRMATPTTRRQTTQRMTTPTTRRQTTQRMATPTTRRQITQRMTTPTTRRQTTQRMTTPTTRRQTNQRMTTPTTRRQTNQRIATPTTRRQTTQRLATPTTRGQTIQRMATPTTTTRTTRRTSRPTTQTPTVTRGRITQRTIRPPTQRPKTTRPVTSRFSSVRPAQTRITTLSESKGTADGTFGNRGVTIQRQRSDNIIPADKVGKEKEYLKNLSKPDLTPIEAYFVCDATDVYKTIKGIRPWCVTNCIKGFCPQFLCTPDCMVLMDTYHMWRHEHTHRQK